MTGSRPPDHVLVIGGGRWARVIVTVLANLLPAWIPISLQAVRNHAIVREWVNQQGLSARVSVVWERPMASQGMVVIVANAAGDHAAAVRWALEHHLPVLVEKPVTLRAADTAELIGLAQRTGTLLCAGHVFLFASDLRDFLAQCVGDDLPTSLGVRWIDASAEVRHGEAKSYDPAVPVHADCLPHVLSMLWALHDGATEITSVAVTRGGAHETLSMRIGEVLVSIELERNGHKRERRLEVMSERGRFSLDFSSEPGTIITPDGMWSTRQWRPTEDRPLAAMLKAFLAAAAGKPIDPRLAVQTGYRANRVIDSVSGLYHRSVWSWTAEKLRVSADLDDADLRYRLTEDLQADRRLSPIDLAAEMVRFMGMHGGESASRLWLEQRLMEI